MTIFVTCYQPVPMNYQRLGDHIREVNIRNRELRVTKLVGLTIDKAFIPSVANVIGTDLSNYKVICREQFACSLMQVSRDGKIPVAMFEEDEAIMSPAYPMFEVIDKSVLLPQYLMMWFSRSEFDREASYYAVGGVRGSLTWEDFCNMRLPVPPIERQREIVAEYETLTRRIRLNEQIIQRLEDTAQALYRNTFVDNIDKQNLPPGWHLGKLSDLAEITMGQSPDGQTYNIDGDGIIFYQGRTDFGKRFPTPRVYTTNPTRYAQKGDVLLSVRAPVGDINITPHDCCIGRGLASLRSKMGFQSYLYYQLFALSSVFNVSDDEGTIFGSINKDDLHSIEVAIPPLADLQLFESQASVFDKEIKIKDKEINNLTELQSLLLSKMGQS